MKKSIFLSAVFILILFLGCSKPQEEYSSIIFYIGDVKKNNMDVDIGEIIKQNDSITTGTQSSCDIKIGESIIRIKEKSKLMLSELSQGKDKENITLGLDVGKVLCKAKKLSKSESFLVKTPTAVAGVRGTKFTVESDAAKTSRIKVFNGEVKVIKRVKQLEDKIETIMDKAPSLVTEEKVVITAGELKTAEKVVEKAFEKEKSSGTPVDEVSIVKIIDTVKDDVVVSSKEIEKFKVEDFKNENAEMIAVEEKPKDIINKIQEIVKAEKKEPVPEGTLLITRYEIHFIKDGKPVWEGKVINPAIENKDRLYIASGSYVFCASADGPVLWKRKIENNGKLEIIGDKLIVSSKGRKIKLDIVNGM